MAISKEEERIREKALLTDEEIQKVVDEAYSKDSLLQHYVESRGRWEYIAPIIAQAQLDKLLKLVRVEADSQEPPENPYIDEPNGYVYEEAQQDMLKADFVRCLSKEEK